MFGLCWFEKSGWSYTVFWIICSRRSLISRLCCCRCCPLSRSPESAHHANEVQWPRALCLWSPWVVMEFLRNTMKTLWAPRVWFLLCCSWPVRLRGRLRDHTSNCRYALVHCVTALRSYNVKMQVTKHLALEAWQAEGKTVLEWKPFHFSCLLIYMPSECCHLAKCLLCFCQAEVAAGKN